MLLIVVDKGCYGELWSRGGARRTSIYAALSTPYHSMMLPRSYYESVALLRIGLVRLGANGAKLIERER